MFDLASTKPGRQVGGEATVQGLRRLLKTIQRAIKLTHLTRTSGLDKVGRLDAVHHLSESIVKEDILDI